MAEAARPERDPLVWRVPPWQPAGLFVVASVLAAWNIYGSPGAVVRILTIPASIIAIVAAILALRVAMVVDDDGITVRKLVSQRSVDWSDVADIEVLRNRLGNWQLRVVCHDSAPMTVPESLLLPSKPTGSGQVAGQLRATAHRIMAYPTDAR